MNKFVVYQVENSTEFSEFLVSELRVETPLGITPKAGEYAVINMEDKTYVMDRSDRVRDGHVMAISLNHLREHLKRWKRNVHEVNVQISDSTFKMQQILDGVKDLVAYKNEKYKNAALVPTVKIFAGKCKVGEKVDEKLTRINNATELSKNDVVDVIGYLIKVCEEKDWTDFSEFKD